MGVLEKRRSWNNLLEKRRSWNNLLQKRRSWNNLLQTRDPLARFVAWALIPWQLVPRTGVYCDEF
jgi:hypothetical protein